MSEINYSKRKLTLALTFLCVNVIPSLVTGSLPEEFGTRKPCEYRYAISMPGTGQCLVPVQSGYNWTRAQGICELAGGSLYQMPLDIQHTHRKVLDCLVSKTSSTFSDMWINPVAQLMPQFIWLNGDALHPITHCPSQLPPNTAVGPQSAAPTIEACLMFCRKATTNWSHAFLLNNRKFSQCYCVNDLDDIYKTPCDTSVFTYRNTTHLFMAPTSQAPIVEIGANQTASSGELLCVGLDRQADGSVHLKSYPCFKAFPFICDLGNATECPQKLCDRNNCVFPWRGTCLRRVDCPLDWLEAHAFCNTSGGVLWQTEPLPVPTAAFSQHVSRGLPYWIGASNFELENGTDSASLEKYSANFLRVRCGHLQLSQAGRRWQWHNTACDQPKPFLCQFGTPSINPAGGEAADVICPWPTGPTVPPIIVPLPTTPHPKNADSFPIAALISGILAVMILLVCLTVCCAWCCRRKMHRNRKSSMKVALVPYLMARPRFPPGNNNGRGMIENTASNRGSGVLIESIYSQVDDSSQNGNNSRSDIQLKNSSGYQDQLNKSTNETMSIDPENIIADKASTCKAQINNPRGYMTLEGSMDIEEIVNLDEPFPEKPEVTLVTDHVDLNFTINRSASLDDGIVNCDVKGSSSSLDRTLDEIQTPVFDGSLTLTLPNRMTKAGCTSAQSYV